jgi:hypothetical protein
VFEKTILYKLGGVLGLVTIEVMVEGARCSVRVMLVDVLSWHAMLQCCCCGRRGHGRGINGAPP